METSNSYVYFALKGDDFDPLEVTKKLGVNPTNSWRTGDKGTYNPSMKYSCWELSTGRGIETLDIDKLVLQIIEQLKDKIDLINQLKSELNLNSVLEIVLDIDVNPEVSTPSLGHDLRTISFLHKTGTVTDVDIYRFNSQKETNTQQRTELKTKAY